jgi:hypothetical protein
LTYCSTAPQAIKNARTTDPTQTALTVAFCSLRPKKNMIAAPMAGNSGMSQMWERNIRFQFLKLLALSL